MILISTKIHNDGRLARNEYPFTRDALYKIEEMRSYLMKDSKTIERLILYSHSHSGSPLLGGCTWEERREWLRRTLRGIPYRLGYELSPAIETLALKSLSQSEVDPLQRYVSRRVACLLLEVDLVYNQINRGMSPEYRAWKKGESLIKKILDEAITLADEVISHCKDRTPLHGVHEKFSSEQTKRSFEAERRL